MLGARPPALPGRCGRRLRSPPGSRWRWGRTASARRACGATRASAFAISQGWRELAAYALDDRPTHALYYGILKLWPGAASSEFVLRSLSVVCAAAAAALMAVLAARLFGRVAGFSAGVLFAVNPFVIAYAQEARMYALVALLTVIASLLFVRAIEGPSTRRWLVYAVSAVALVYAHAVAGSVLIAHAIAFLLRSP